MRRCTHLLSFCDVGLGLGSMSVLLYLRSTQTHHNSTQCASGSSSLCYPGRAGRGGALSGDVVGFLSCGRARVGCGTIDLSLRETGEVDSNYLRYVFTMSITSSAARVCSEFGLRLGSNTWCRMCPSNNSVIRLLTAPLAALMICNTSEQSRPSSRIRSKASNCPRMRLLRRINFCLFLIV